MPAVPVQGRVEEVLAGHLSRCGCWPPRDLLGAAAERLRDIAETEHLRPDEYARLLTYRVELLTHHAATIDAGRLSDSDGRAGRQVTLMTLGEGPVTEL